MNPGGSVKDRAALYMIDNARRSGAIKEGGKTENDADLFFRLQGGTRMAVISFGIILLKIFFLIWPPRHQSIIYQKIPKN